MGEWLLSRRDRLIVARHEVPLEFGRLERATRGDLRPEGATGFSPGFNPGTLEINEFVLKGEGLT
jgi:hypothetical protein